MLTNPPASRRDRVSIEHVMCSVRWVNTGCVHVISLWPVPVAGPCLLPAACCLLPACEAEERKNPADATSPLIHSQLC